MSASAQRADREVLPGAGFAAAGQAGPGRILILEDSRAQRRLLSSLLGRWGYDVLACETPQQALAELADPSIRMVLSDWMMPDMTGPEFCSRVRGMDRDGYTYILLLTSIRDKDAIAHGLDAGADDFLSKPVDSHELRARMRAGVRILQMQRKLEEQNHVVSQTLDEIRALYDALDRDLSEAQKLQASLLRETERDFDRASAAFLLQSSGRVGGDLVGHFSPAPAQVGLFSLDVSGHGVTSAMLTARLAGLLSAASPDQNIAMRRTRKGRYEALPPEEVAARLNRMMLEEVETDLYFTLCLALVCLDTGRVDLVQAGHPHPVLQTADGDLRFLGKGGMPVGLLPEATYEPLRLWMSPGDRLFVHSDGVTEAPAPDGALLGEAGLAGILCETADLPAPSVFPHLLAALADHTCGADLPDDISAMVFDYRG